MFVVVENEIINQKEMNNESVNNTATDGAFAPLGKKRDVAVMLKVSVRSVDNYMAEGMPHMKITPRCVRFDLHDVRDWFKSKYGQQCRKAKHMQN